MDDSETLVTAAEKDRIMKENCCRYIHCRLQQPARLIETKKNGQVVERKRQQDCFFLLVIDASVTEVSPRSIQQIEEKPSVDSPLETQPYDDRGDNNNKKEKECHGHRSVGCVFSSVDFPFLSYWRWNFKKRK